MLAFNLSASSSTRTCSTASISPACPFRNEDRAPEHPLVIVGGHCAYNPEPLAEYVDAFVIGDGEEVISESPRSWARGSAAAGRRRDAVLRDLATIAGVYVPSMYDVTYDGRSIRR